MYSKLSIIAVAAGLAQLATAVGSARVVNKCSNSVTLWSVGSDVAGPYTLGTNGAYSEQFVVDPTTGGKALKITTTSDGLYTGAPQTIFSYSLDGDSVWYDLSDVFGDAFSGHKVVEASADTSCPAITWDNGTPPAGSQVKKCGSGSDVTLTLCA
ncbi:putative bys1 family protein [Phaeoacremonium minimum UCRPA7]|uniref:Putative bys1 family protein n=1 Tax=Phaeoacremonium minimum (strain UCR-PA7) TaxID=1286976 RepID=R8BMX5_PHAM7|nr:putative bys1 family protein [Phaeoacremonium minimum UCRPA7]EOO00625.1 putative bys1 family protein [Phaeoacremonium minimum UCRPA7]